MSIMDTRVNNLIKCVQVPETLHQMWSHKIQHPHPICLMIIVVELVNTG